MTGSSMYFIFSLSFHLAVTGCRLSLRRKEYKHRYIIRFLRTDKRPWLNMLLFHCRWRSKYIVKNWACPCLPWWRLKKWPMWLRQSISLNKSVRILGINVFSRSLHTVVPLLRSHDVFLRIQYFALIVLESALYVARWIPVSGKYLLRRDIH